MKKEETAAIFFVGMGLFYLIVSLKYDMGSINYPQMGFFPRMIGCAIVLCSGLVLLNSIRKRKQNNKLCEIFSDLSLKNIQSTFVMITVLIGYLLILDYVGFLVASPILIFFLAWLMGGNKVMSGGKWILTGLSGIILTFFLYWMFWIMMRIPIPMGSLWKG